MSNDDQGKFQGHFVSAKEKTCTSSRDMDYPVLKRVRMTVLALYNPDVSFEKI